MIGYASGAESLFHTKKLPAKNARPKAKRLNLPVSKPKDASTNKITATIKNAVVMAFSFERHTNKRGYGSIALLFIRHCLSVSVESC